MPTKPATDDTLRAENAELRARLEEAEETLRAIRAGEVDALVVQGDAGPCLFTLQGLDAEQNRLRGEMLAQVSDAVIAVDLEERVTFLNAAAERQYRVRSGDVLGRKLDEIYTRVWPSPEAEGAMWTTLRERGEWRGELIQRTPDGRELHVETTRTALRGRDGATTGYVAAIRDICERKRAEEELFEQRRLYKSVTDNASVSLFIMDERQQCLFMNPAAEELTGFTLDEVRGKALHDLIHHSRPDGSHYPLCECPIDQAFPHNDREQGEEVFVHKDGHFYHVAFTASPIRDRQGKPVGTVIEVEDITERHEADLTLRAAKEAAEAANAAKDRFLAMLSHELRTPLTPVLMAVAALEHDPELSADVREDLVMIKRNIELETKLIDDLLDVSRIAAGKVALKIEPLELNTVVGHVCASCRSQMLGQHVRFETDLAADAGCLAADSARLQQVIWNLLRNALKFTPDGGSIRVSTARLGGRCEVRVSDSGIGIAPEVLPHIFDAFEQGGLGVTRQYGGLGLGLAISKALVELHGGSIRAECAGLGCGTTFIIELPGQHGPGAPTAPAATAAAGNGTERIRLLVVEDHADTARTLSRLLRRAGFAVFTASDVATAMAAAEREPFDVLVSDLGLPDGTGYDVLAGVQKVQPLPGIAMSGYGTDEDVSKTRAAGFREHLVKPIEVPKLIAAIRRVRESKA